MDKAKKNPQLIVILAILLVTGVVLAQKFSSVVKPTVSNRVSADEGEDGDRAEEVDDEEDRDDEDEGDKEESKRDDEDEKDDEKDENNSERSKLRTQKFEDDEEDEADDDQDENDDLDDEDEAGEDIKDISELIAKVENKISLVAASGGNVDGFNATLTEVRDLVVQAQAKLAAGDKAGAEDLIETADDKLENLEEAVKLVLGEREDDDEEDEAEDQDGSDEGDEDNSQMAKEYKNIVAQFVHDLKAIMELEGVKDGIGSQVSAVAQTQNASQERVVEILDRIEDRSALEKFLVGPDLGSLDEIKEEIAKNQATIQVLTQMLGQTDNANVKIVLQRQIQVLTQENLKLDNYVAATENAPSLFGWVVRLFS